MKKLLSVSLALVFVFALALTALAAPNDGVLDVAYSIVPDSLTPFRPEVNRDAP